MSKIKNVPKEVLDYEKKLEDAGTQELDDRGLFNTSTMVQSMRNSAYKDITEAICDIVDNAIEADADRIDVLTTDKNGKLTGIGILDNGYGMSKLMLEDAIRWGGSHKHDLINEGVNSKTRDIGRFGAALPTTSTYATRTTTIYSKTRKSACHRLNFFLEEIVRADREHQRFRPTAMENSLPEFAEKYIEKNFLEKDNKNSYTLVHWDNPDKIYGYTRVPDFDRKVLLKLGYVFKTFLSVSSERHVRIFVNGKRVDMIDPLFLEPEGRGYDVGNGVFSEKILNKSFAVVNKHSQNSEGKKVERKGKIRMRMSYLPFGKDNKWFAHDSESKKIPQRWEVMKQNQGYFNICREGRQICNYGTRVNDLNFPTTKNNTVLQNNDRQWVIELDFDAELDELFNITYLKNEVIIHDNLWQWLEDVVEIPDYVAQCRKKIKEATEWRNAEDDRLEKEKDLRSEKVIDIVEKIFEDDAYSPTDETLEQGRKNLLSIATEMVQKNQAKSVEEATAQIKQQYNIPKSLYSIDFNDKGKDAFFYEKAYIENQLHLLINKGHRFYTDIYTHLKEDVKRAFELVLFAMVKAEAKADTTRNTDRIQFYKAEKKKWSDGIDRYLERYEDFMEDRRKEDDDDEQEI